MSDNFSYDVFLSHNSKDKPSVRRLADRLKQAGLRVWFDEWCIRSGDIISLKVDEGLEQSRVLLLCVSPNALASGWVALERSTAVHRDPSNDGRRFIPVLLAECELPDTLRRYKYVDFRGDGDVSLEELLTACRPEAAEAIPIARPTPAREPTQNRQAMKPPEHTEPLAVFERKMTGHKKWVRSVTVSPDNKWVTSGSDDPNIKIWDLQTGECELTREHWAAFWSKVWSLAITPDATRILSASDHALMLWAGQSVLRLASRDLFYGEYVSVVTLQDNARALSGEMHGTLKVWDLASRSCVMTIKGPTHETDNLLCCDVNQAGTHALSGHRNGSVRLWNLESGECLATLKCHSDIVYSVKFSWDGQFFVSGSQDQTIKIWNVEAGNCVLIMEGHQASVHSVAISPSGALIASTGFSDHTIRLWDWTSGRCLQVIESDDEIMLPISVAFSPDGARLVVGTVDGPIYLYRLAAVSPPPADTDRRYVNAKVVLLGEGTVGKTSLAHRLIDDKYVVKDRTHGMNVWRLDLPLPPDAMLEREALLWDLAGQEDYRLIHQLFLEQTALALLLVNPQKDDPFAEAGDWLKALKTASGQPESSREAARLLIFSQTDVGGMKLGNAKIDRFREQYGFTDWLQTSAKTGENCSDTENDGQPSKLKQLIAESIPWDKLPWTRTPRLLAELKDAMMAMRDKTDIRLVRFAELSQRMEHALPGEKFGEAEVRTAVTLLANNGLARPLKFGDLVLLQPELLNGYSGAIIRAARAHTDEIGCVLESDIYGTGFDFTGVERLKHRPDEELLLRALVQTFLDHSLCIAEDMEQGRQLVFPSQYRREKDIPRDPDIFVSYSFSGEWQTVWTTLVVRLWYSREFEHRELWRNAAEFASSKGHTLGLKIDNRQGEGAATISLYFDVKVSDELKAIFIEYVHRHLAKFGCEVSRDRRYVCPECRKPVKDLDAVRKRLDAKKDFITCQECDGRVPLIDFIEQRLESDLVAREILAMDAIATRELDTQALEQILIGHMMATCGEANQIFRPTSMSDYGIDGEVEFKDDDGRGSGKKVYVQLRSWNYYDRTNQTDGTAVFSVKKNRYFDYWISQPVDVYLVIRQKDESIGQQSIRWMNVTHYLKNLRDKKSRQIIFKGEKLDMEAVWQVRDQFFPLKVQTRK